MADGTGIEWTDATWNPIVGCSVVSPGCTNCYAMRVAGARTAHTAKYQGLTKASKAGPVWTGDVRLWERALTEPLRWREPRRIFVNSMGDLFHPAVPAEWIDRVFAVMALAPQHVFQILTKRPENMRAYVLDALGRVADRVEAARSDRSAVGPLPNLAPGDQWWPLLNVWLGVSIEDQPRADDRIPILLDTPAAVRWISAEPLLGPVDLTNIGGQWSALDDGSDDGVAPAPTLDWVVAGGESGAGARPMHPDWVRSLRDQCVSAGVPFLFKQWGEWAPHTVVAGSNLGGDVRSGRVRIVHPTGQSDVQVFTATGRNTVPGSRYMEAVGKARAGRLLDGRQWDEYPARSSSPDLIRGPIAEPAHG